MATKKKTSRRKKTTKKAASRRTRSTARGAASRTKKKAPARKKTPAKKTAKDGAIVPVATKATKSVTFRSAPKRGTMYQPVLDEMATLKKGQSCIVPVPKGTPPRTIHNRLNAALRRFPVSPPKGCTFVKRTTEDGQVAISCEAA